MTKKQQIIAQISLVIIILFVSVIAMKGLASLRKPPEKKERRVSYPLLNAVQVHPETFKMTIAGNGSVEPRSNVQVVPQVSGRIVECHADWVDGGFFKAGELLLVIEQTDYQLAVQSAEAAVAQAGVALEQEQAEADIARREWEKLHPGQPPQSDLVFRGPQIKSAQAQLKAAQAQLEKARLDLERTEITMPFDGRIVSTNVDVGQFITAGSPIATVYRTDLVEITVPLENEELAWFAVPLSMNDGRRPDACNSSAAKVSTDFAGKTYSWQGRAVRTEGQIDAKSRMVGVIVQVDNPFKTNSDRIPLIPGTFVDVDIMGKQVDNVVRVPRYAMHGKDDHVWIASQPDAERVQNSPDEQQEQFTRKTLRIVTVKAIRLDKEYAYISEGLDDGDIVITSPLETVTDGMQVRIVVEGSDEQGGDA